MNTNPPDDDLTVHVDLQAVPQGVEETLRKVAALEETAKRLQATLKAVEQQAVKTFNAALASGPPKTGAAAMLGGAQFGGGAVGGYGELRDLLNSGARPVVEQAAPDIKPHLDAILSLKAKINAVVNAQAQAQTAAAQAGVPVEQQPAAIATLAQSDKHADHDDKTYRAAEAQAKKADLAEEKRAKRDQEKQEQQTLRDEQRYRQAEAQARKSDLADEARDKKKITQIEEKAARQRERDAAKYVPFSERLAGSVFSARTLSGIGALSTGDAGPLGRTLAYAFVTSLARTPISALRPAAGAVAAELGAGEAGVGEGAAIGGTEAAAGGAAAPSIATMLAGLLSGPLALIIGGVALAAGAAIIGNTMQSNARADQVSMLGNVAGVDLNRPSAEEAAILTQGNRFFYSPDETRNAANQLGNAGVNGNDLPKVLADTLTFARRTGMQLPQATELGGIIASQNNASGAEDQVSAVFQTIEDAARSAGIPVTRLATAVKTLATASAGAGLTVGAVNGVAAIQSLFGPTGTAFDAGQLMQPAMTATGFQATQMAGMLGLSEDQLAMMQKEKPAALLDRIASFAKRATPHATGMARIDRAEGILQQTGLLNLTGVDPAHAATFTEKLLTEGSGAAQKYADSLAAKTAPKSGGAYRDSGANVAGQITPAMEQLKLHAEYAAAQLAHFGNNVKLVSDDLASADKELQPAHNPSSRAATEIANARQRAGLPQGMFDFSLSGAEGITGNKVLPPGGIQVPNSRGQTDTLGKDLAARYSSAAARYGVPASLLISVGARETDLHSDRTARDGGMGLMQFQPATLDALRKQKGSPIYGLSLPAAEKAAYDPTKATTLGAYYLRQLYDQGGKNWHSALGVYNGGPNWRSTSAARGYADATFSNAQAIAAIIGKLPTAPPPPVPAPTALPPDVARKINATPHVVGIATPTPPPSSLAVTPPPQGTPTPVPVDIHVTVHDPSGHVTGKTTQRTRVDLGRRPTGHVTHGPKPVHLDAHAPPGRGG